MVLFLQGHSAVLSCDNSQFNSMGLCWRWRWWDLLGERVHNEAKPFVYTQTHTRTYIYKAV